MLPVSSASAVDKQACKAEVRRHRSNDALVKIASSWAALSLRRGQFGPVGSQNSGQHHSHDFARRFINIMK